MLIDQINPEILDKLGKNHSQYTICIDSIYNTLSTTQNWQQLKMSTIADIILFAHVDTNEWSSYDWRWGNKIIIDKYTI